MAHKGRLFLGALLLLTSVGTSLYGMFPSLTQNDPLPLFSTVFPNDFLATRQKANLMRYDYTYAPARFRVSVSGYRQYANRAKDSERQTIYPGDIHGRWNMLAFFWDPKMRDVLYPALGINTPGVTPPNPDFVTIPEDCIPFLENPKFSDPRQEFGFFSIPLLYRKYGVRFESELLIIDKCFYAVGIMAQWGINDIRQTVLNFNDMTCQALGTACPTNKIARGVIGKPSVPPPAAPIAVAPPFVDPSTVPPCPQPACNPNGDTACVVPLQPFQAQNDETLNLAFPDTCKEFVIENIMSQRDKIAHILGLDICNYHKVGMDDLRLSAYWRHIFVINEDNEKYPRLLFMPFAQVGVGIPMMKEIKNNTVFALPNGNNRHTFIGGRAGFTLDFLDTIDIYAVGGFSYFFEREYCNYRLLPTNTKESGIFPYSADVLIRPGPTWNINFGMNAYHFLDNLSVWAEYAIVSHTDDKIKVCRSFIPQGSIYFEQGFDVDRAECLSKWEVHVVNVGFNYDLFDSLSIGLLWQAPVKQRNAYRSGMVMGSITFVY